MPYGNETHMRSDPCTSRTYFSGSAARAGLSIREDQIQLCYEMLNSLFWGRFSLSDAGVGIGKTHAYLLACMLWRLH